MPKSFTRLELYNLLWANTMRKFAEIHGVTAADVRRLATDADLPLPGPGYWTLLAMGRQVDKTPLHPNPDKDGVTFVVLGAPKKKPKSKQSSAPKAQAIIEEHTSKQGDPKPECSLPEKPKDSVTLTRQDLHDAVWQTPMVRVGEQYGITGNGLAKICDRLGVPYPPRGYWAKSAVGKAPPKTPLPVNAEVDQTVVIRPSPPPVELPFIPEEVSKKLNSLRSVLGLVQIPERLSRPHPVISRWIEARRQERDKAKTSRSVDFTVMIQVHLLTLRDVSTGFWMPHSRRSSAQVLACHRIKITAFLSNIPANRSSYAFGKNKSKLRCPSQTPRSKRAGTKARIQNDRPSVPDFTS